MTTLRFAQAFIRGSSFTEVRAALVSVLACDGLQAFDPGRIPAGYPAEAGEFDRWLLAGPDSAGIVALVAENVHRMFARAGGLAIALPVATIAVLVRPPADHMRIKGYRGGALCLKIGDDPDDELFYHPLQAEAPAIGAFLHFWGSRANPTEPDPESVAMALGVARTDCTYAAARAGGWPVPVTELIFVSTRSRLYMEA